MTNNELCMVASKKDLHDFTMLPFDIYRANAYWVPPLISDYKKYVMGHNNNLNVVGPNIKFLVRQNGKVAGRILVGIDNRLNAYKGLNDGYISQFEVINDYEAAEMLLDAAINWLKNQGIQRVKGPVSLPDGEDNRGFIIDNFKSHTTIMNTYNMPYYNDFFIKYGFEKYADCYAFETRIRTHNVERYERLVPKTMQRYKFRLDTFDRKNVEREASDIKYIIETAMPKDWEDFMPLSKEDVDKVVKQLIAFVDSDLLFIARTLDDKPIGFNITLPDYNQVLRKMKGHKSVISILKFLMLKKKINKLRTFVLFVVPEYRNRGVTSAIYLQTYINALKKGYKSIEGSTIWDYNTPMLNEIERLGIRKKITYRIYQMDV